MSFGPSGQEKTAINNQSNIANQAVDLSNQAVGLSNQAVDASKVAQGNAANYSNLGTGLFNLGGGNVQSGTNFFNTMLNGNQANTAATLQPDISRIRDANQQSIQALSTLMPRGGGRSGTLFQASYAPQAQIQSLYNGTRSAAAGNLASLGLQQQGMGTNLFNIGNQAFGLGNQALGIGDQALGTSNQALGTGLQGNQNVYQNAYNNRQYSNSMWGQLGAGLFGLATTPFGASGRTVLQRL